MQDQVLFISLGILCVNAFLKFVLVRKHKLQIEAAINSKNLDTILDSDVVKGSDKKELSLQYPIYQMLLMVWQFIIALMILFLYPDFNLPNKLWVRLFIVAVIWAATIASFIYFVYLNEEEI